MQDQPDLLYSIDIESLAPCVNLAHYLGTPNGLNLDWRYIPDFEIVYFLGGRGEFEILDETIEFGEGDVLFTPPYAWHRYRCIEPPNPHYAVHFSVGPEYERQYRKNAAVRAGYNELSIHLSDFVEVPVRCPGFPGRHVDLFDEIIRHKTEVSVSGFALAQLKLHRALVSLLCALADHVLSGRASEYESFQKSINHIDSHFASNVRIDALASLENKSPNYYSTRFRAVYGISPIEYVTLKRLELAKRLLNESSLRINEIARRCGYEDQYYFSRVFRKYEGMPPRKYREVI